jgi:hypothetical protein
MSEQSDSQVAERDWARTRFREYLLGRLDMEESERLTTAVALLPGLVDDLEEAEEELIETYLNNRLRGDDQIQFERQYVHGNDEDNKGKLRLQQALRSPELKSHLKLPDPVPVRVRRGIVLGLAALAASVAAIVLAVLYQQQSQQLATALAKLKSQEAPIRQPRTPQPAPEERAGLPPIDGVRLPAGAAGTIIINVASQPRNLIWTPVPDYRSQYRIRVYASSGEERTSPLLTPKDNAVEYSLDNPSTLVLPLDVFVLGPSGTGEKALAHYVLAKP